MGRVEGTWTDCVITVFTLNTLKLKGLGWITAMRERVCLSVCFCVRMYVMVICLLFHRSPCQPLLNSCQHSPYLLISIPIHLHKHCQVQMNGATGQPWPLVFITDLPASNKLERLGQISN